MLRTRPQELKLGVSGVGCVDKKFSTKRKGADLV